MSLLLTLNIFHIFSSVSIFNFERVIAGWEKMITWHKIQSVLISLALSSITLTILQKHQISIYLGNPSTEFYHKSGTVFNMILQNAE